MYTHTIYSADGVVISVMQRTEPLHPAPRREYAKLAQQLIAEAWNLRGTELFRRSATNQSYAVMGKL